MRNTRLLAALFLAFPAAAGEAPDGPVDLLRLAAGQPEGVYYEIASRLQRQTNANAYDHRLHVSTVATAGSVENVGRLASGASDIAVIQGDVFVAARAGTLPGLAGPMTDLRALFLATEETFALIVRADRAAEGLAGLRGRRVALGEPGSGARFTSNAVLQSQGLWDADFRSVSDAAISRRAIDFCEGRIDAAAFVLAPESAVLRRLVTECGGVALGLPPATLDEFRQRTPAYRAMAPRGWLATPGAVRGGELLGIASAVATLRAPDDAVARFVRTVFDPPESQSLRRVVFDPEADPCDAVPPEAVAHPAAYDELQRLGLAPADDQDENAEPARCG